MFGFGRLASYDYFTHLERALAERIRAAGDQVDIHVAQVSPTASIRRRALKLTELVARTCDLSAPQGGPIHLIGHSTGGLDARLVASPSVSLAVAPGALAWRSRLASVTTINAPHFGTPLASFFTTASGQRVLRALSALTFIALSVGSPPLAVASALVMAFSRIDRSLGLELKIVDRVTDSLLRVLDEARGQDVRDYLDAISGDQGAMVQLMPEAMDLYVAGVEDRAGVLYQSTASMAPAPSAHLVLPALPHPWRVVSGGIFAILHGITARFDRHYPCSAEMVTPDAEQLLARTFGSVPAVFANDGVVPIRSQIWGKLIWTGYGDHLDVLGHFGDRSSVATQVLVDGPPAHVDWLYSGSDFGRAQFAALVDAITTGVLASVRSR